MWIRKVKYRKSWMIMRMMVKRGIPTMILLMWSEMTWISYWMTEWKMQILHFLWSLTWKAAMLRMLLLRVKY